MRSTERLIILFFMVGVTLGGLAFMYHPNLWLGIIMFAAIVLLFLITFKKERPKDPLLARSRLERAELELEKSVAEKNIKKI